MTARLPGRQFFANPGPTNIPDSVLREMSRATVDFMAADFLEVYDRCVSGVKRVLGTAGDVFFYTASGHGAWEATIVNLFSPGDAVLVVESGVFSESWAGMMRSHGLDVRTVAADWRRGLDCGALTQALRGADAEAIRAVCVVHNETSTGMMLDLREVRAAMDAAGHDALLLVDGISSVGSLPLQMDAWGIDAMVGGSQKGLMLPVGFSFTAVSPRAMAAHAQARLARHYFDWTVMLGRRHRSFVGTVPAGLFFALAESLRLLEAEGMDAVLARHHRLGGAVRAAVRAWSGNEGPHAVPARPRPRLGLGDGRADAGGARRRGGATRGAGARGVAGRRSRAAGRAGVPHRPPGRPERAHGDRRAGRGGAGPARRRRAARPRRGARGGGRPGRLILCPRAGGGTTSRPAGEGCGSAASSSGSGGPPSGPERPSTRRTSDSRAESRPVRGMMAFLRLRRPTRMQANSSRRPSR